MSVGIPSIYTPSRWGEIYHATTQDEVLGGGSAGPGKTMVLLMDPIAQVIVEHNRCADPNHQFPLEWGRSTGWALHLRRTIKELEQTIVRSKRIFKLIDPGADWSEQKTTWTFSSGYRFQFGHCQNATDWQSYLGGEYCAAAGTGVLMADGSFRAIESVEAGEFVQTLEGPKRVTATWNTGPKPCVSATVQADGIGYVGTQVHPTTHPVMLSSIGIRQYEGSRSTPQAALRSHALECVWQDYESLLLGRPESPVKRASLAGEGSGCEESGDSLPEGWRLRELTVPVVLHAPTVRRVEQSQQTPTGYRERRSEPEQSERRHQESQPPSQMRLSGLPRAARVWLQALGRTLATAVCGDACERRAMERAKGSPGHCSSCRDPRGARTRDPGGSAREFSLRSAYVGTPGHGRLRPDGQHQSQPGIPCTGQFYPHFYSGDSRPRTEAVHKGTATIRFAGWHQTYDLTVEGANHYITETGLVNAQTHIGFDELVTFLEEQYDNIKERLRSTDPVLKWMLKVRSMSNPVVSRMEGDNYAIDPYWVRKRFVDFNPAGNEVQVLQEQMPNGKVIEKTLLFLPARLSDNPDPDFVEQYTRKLMFAKPHIRAAQLYGNWYVTAGSFFGDEWNDKLHVIKPFHIPPSWKRFRAMDWGYKKPGVVLWFAMDDEDNLICERELTFKGMTVKKVAEHIQRIEEDLGLWHGKRSLIHGVADTQLWEKRGEEGMSKAEEFAACGIQWSYADKKSRARNAERIAERLGDHDNGTKSPGLVFFDTCKKCIQTLPSIQTDPSDPSVPVDGGEDHHVDTIGYGCAFASRGRLGIPSVMRKSRADDEDEREQERQDRGRWGYGGA